MLNKRLVVPVWSLGALAVAVVVGGFYVAAATSDDENVVLARNEVVDGTWHGAMMNRTDSVYREVAVTIRFLDADGRIVDEVGGRAERLEPGQRIALEAPLPDGAQRLQVHSLQWRTGDRGETGALLGPWAPWEFGYLQYDPTS